MRARQGTGMTRFLITTVSTIALCAGAAHAQGVPTDETTLLERISVTANRTATETGKVGSTISVVTEEEIEQKSFVTVTDYLTGLPGINFSQSGGRGTSGNIYVRGLPGAYVKTFYNGIDISDVTGTQVQTSYQYFLTGGVSSIEVLKGSQSTLYGSTAIAGVVDIQSLGDIEEGLHHSVHVEGGTDGTVRGQYGLSGAKDGSRFAASITGFHTDGISSLPGGTERDGFDNLTIDVAAEHRVNDIVTIFGSLLFIDALAEFDNNFPVDQPNDPVSNEAVESLGARVGARFDSPDGRLTNMIAYQTFKSDRLTQFGTFIAPYEGERNKIDYQGSFEATDRLLLQYGADYERQSAEAEGTTLGEIDLTGVWTQASFEPLDDLIFTAGVRHDQHSTFGGYTSYRGTVSYLVPGTDARLHSSLGTGFRAPSLYELYAPFLVGNTALTPETSASFDIGVEYSFLGGDLVTDLTYFRIETDDLIDFVFDGNFPFGGYYDQVDGRSRSEGVEASFKYRINDALQLGGSYTYTDAIVPSQTGPGFDRRSRIPAHVAILSAIYTPAEKWTISGDVRFVADTVERNIPLDDYVLVNAKVAYQVTDSAEVYLRGENLLNQDYQTARGYNTPGFGAFAGFKAKF